MEDFLARNWEHLTARLDGPLTFRLIVQPVVASILAIRSGRKDAREGRPVFFWTMVLDPVQRHYLLRQGCKDVGALFIVALVLDGIYQLIVFRWLYLGQLLIVAATLALVPYLVMRGVSNRIARRRHCSQQPESKESNPTA